MRASSRVSEVFLPEVNRRAPIGGPTRHGAKIAIRVNQGDGTMKLYKFYLIASLAGTLAAAGCGDDGGGGVDPNESCNVEFCIDNATLK